jgi:type VI secretion system protein ImpG
VWIHAIDGSTATEPCSATYGAYDPEPEESDFFEHPLHRSRAEMHFPQQELFVRVRQIASPRQWQRLTVCFDLGPEWPAGLRLSADCFQLHVVPMMNVRRETADALEHDATQERHLLHHPDPRGGFVPLSVHAVYRTTSDGLAPLQPAIVGADADSYEAVCEGQGPGRRAWVTVNLPDAFEHPETIVADVFWHQPRVSSLRVSDLAVRPSDRFVEGVEWECFGRLAPHADAELEHDRTAMLELLSIKGQRRLGKSELRHLLSALGVPRERPFAKLLEQLSSVTIVDKPHARKGSGFKHVYELVFDNLTPSDVPRLSLFCAKVLEILAAWCVDDVLELVARVPNLDKVVKFAARESG